MVAFEVSKVHACSSYRVAAVARSVATSDAMAWYPWCTDVAPLHTNHVPAAVTDVDSSASSSQCVPL